VCRVPRYYKKAAVLAIASVMRLPLMDMPQPLRDCLPKIVTLGVQLLVDLEVCVRMCVYVHACVRVCV
jgi:hypothetical protein